MIVSEINLNGGDVKSPKLTTYIIDNTPEIDPNRQRPAIIICPGGGYEMTSDREAESIAIKMLSYGLQAFVLRYSVAPKRFPTALIELAKSVAIVRKKQHEWHVDPDKIIVAGFSAGGHLAASLGVFWQEELLKNELKGLSSNWQPNGLLLGYPVITSGTYAHKKSIENLVGNLEKSVWARLSLERQITEFTPKTFLWHTVEDGCVPVENSLVFAEGLQKKKIPFELHIFPKGDHGLSLATKETESYCGNGVQIACEKWSDMFALWVKENI